jgi:hypothetical protein
MSGIESEAQTASVYRYTVSLEGIGGDFASIPLTDEQAQYWAQRGDDALAAHLSLGGDEDDSVPEECQLGDFRVREWLCGVDPDEGVTLTVQHEDGEYCLELSSDDDDFREKMHFSREVGPFDGPPDRSTVMYRSFLKGADVYELTTDKPFDPSRLTLDCAEVSQWGDVIHSVRYDGGEVEYIDGVDREKREPKAVLLQR